MIYSTFYQYQYETPAWYRYQYEMGLVSVWFFVIKGHFNTYIDIFWYWEDIGLIPKQKYNLVSVNFGIGMDFQIMYGSL